MDVEEIVALSVKHNVSDLHLCSDSPPRWRRLGRLEPAPFPPPDVGALLKAWLNDEQQGIWWANGQVDFAATVAGGQRLRGSAFKQMRGVCDAAAVAAYLSAALFAGRAEGIPELLTNASGLILVTGATGSGKSTTLAAMVDFLNHHTDGHILTLEDPVEFIYQSERCLIQQREIGQHSPSFAERCAVPYARIRT
jgi:twitching motility protein PilT